MAKNDKKTTSDDRDPGLYPAGGFNDDNEHPIGQRVHISTVTHAWRGTLLAVTKHYYILDADAVLVESTGPAEKYAQDRKADKESAGLPGVQVRCLRGAIAWMWVLA